MGDFDFDVDCPECRYPIWVRRSELAAQVAVLCPCCRCRVRLVNPDGSAQTVERQINNLVDREAGRIEEELGRMLKGLFG